MALICCLLIAWHNSKPSPAELISHSESMKELEIPATPSGQPDILQAFSEHLGPEPADKKNLYLLLARFLNDKPYTFTRKDKTPYVLEEWKYRIENAGKTEYDDEKKIAILHDLLSDSSLVFRPLVMESPDATLDAVLLSELSESHELGILLAGDAVSALSNSDMKRFYLNKRCMMRLIDELERTGTFNCLQEKLFLQKVWNDSLRILAEKMLYKEMYEFAEKNLLTNSKNRTQNVSILYCQVLNRISLLSRDSTTLIKPTETTTAEMFMASFPPRKTVIETGCWKYFQACMSIYNSKSAIHSKLNKLREIAEVHKASFSKKITGISLFSSSASKRANMENVAFLSMPGIIGSPFEQLLLIEGINNNIILEIELKQTIQIFKKDNNRFPQTMQELCRFAGRELPKDHISGDNVTLSFQESIRPVTNLILTADKNE